VQVERVVAARTLTARDVVIPAALVDAVVIAEPDHHRQTYATAYSHTFTGRFRAPADAAKPMALDARKIIARRSAFELPVNGIVNLGIGMPEGVANVAGEEGLLEHLTLTAEPGVVGGQPASGLDFGAAVNTDAVTRPSPHPTSSTRSGAVRWCTSRTVAPVRRYSAGLVPPEMKPSNAAGSV